MNFLSSQVQDIYEQFGAFTILELSNKLIDLIVLKNNEHSLSFAYEFLLPLVHSKGLIFLYFFDANPYCIMEDDVINNLENMKLTTDEEEVIFISDKGQEAEIESCSLSLIGKFLTCWSFNKRAA